MIRSKFTGIYLIFLFTTTLLISCGNESREATLEMMESPSMQDEVATDQMEITERKLITDGSVEFETENSEQTRKKIIAAVKKHKGYISADEESSSTGRISNRITIRMPSDNFDALLADATVGVDRFEFKTINVKDVTEEFLDIEARLKTKKELEARFLDILKQAKNVTEILEIEKQIAQLRSDIESIEGRLKYLQNQVSYSTLNITFYESVPEVSYNKNRFAEGFANGWDNLVWFFIGLINIWPFILLITVMVVLFRLWRKRSKGL